MAQQPAHWDEAPARHYGLGPMGAMWQDLGKAAGSVNVGLRRVQVDAGRQSTPVHVHDAEEEIFFVLRGSGFSWQGSAAVPVRAGDCIVHAAGAAPHTLIGGERGHRRACLRHQGPGRDVPPAPGRRGVARSLVDRVGSRVSSRGSGRRGRASRTRPSRPIGPAWSLNVDEVRRSRAQPRRLSARHARPGGRALAAQRDPAHECRGRQDRLSPTRAHGRRRAVRGPRRRTASWSSGTAARRVRRRNGFRSVPARWSAVLRAAASHTRCAAAQGGMTYLAYGERNPVSISFYPRSSKLSIRGAGVIGRIVPLDYWDGEE